MSLAGLGAKKKKKKNDRKTILTIITFRFCNFFALYRFKTVTAVFFFFAEKVAVVSDDIFFDAVSLLQCHCVR